VKLKTSTGLYRSCAALASFSCTFDLILFEAILNLLLKRFSLLWFGLDRQSGKIYKIIGFWFALV